jgi:hypothetical protein
MRLRSVLAALLIAAARGPAAYGAERQVQPFIAVSLGARTTFALLPTSVQKPNVVFGARALVLGDIFGIEGDVAHAPGFFESSTLVLHSRVTTMTGNVVIAMPRRLTEYTLRPFFVGGGGVMIARAEDFFGALPVADKLPTLDVGGGVSGFVTSKVGFVWDLRYFRGIAGSEPSEASFGRRLSFWRAGMALALRY